MWKAEGSSELKDYFTSTDQPAEKANKWKVKAQQLLQRFEKYTDDHSE